MGKASQIIAGLQILLKYGDESVCAEHDEIFAGVDTNEMSLDDVDAMEKAGWHWDSNSDSWVIFT